MKTLALLCLITLMSCSHESREPASLSGQEVAYDSMALGNVKATAVKRLDKQDVCFDINLMMKGVREQDALASNWTVAWVDQNRHYHLLNMNQRNPASSPNGADQDWSNSFTACAPKAKLHEVKTLVLTPKKLPYKENKGLYLDWN